jgi:hypothetical protein
MLPDISFLKGQGGLGRPLTGQDFYSALVFYASLLPAGFNSSNRIKQFFSVTDAETAGILADYSDATPATGSYLVTTIGANGDTITISANDLNTLGTPQVIVLGSYTKVAGDSTASLVATAIANAINAGTINHGYSAIAATATVTITAPKRLGVYLNTGTPLVVSVVGTIAGTLTQFTGGVASKLAVFHYHIAEFFRNQPQGVLYVGFFAIPGGAYNFAEITTMQMFANGSIRQIGVFKDSASPYSAGDLTLIDGVCKANDAVHMPLSAVYAADLSATTDISTIADLSLLTANKVSDCIAQDGGGLGNYLWLTSGKSITCLGALLGTIAQASVSESIAWVGEFNISNGSECETLAFANGKLFSDPSVTTGLLSALNDKRHIFLKKFTGLSGSYFNDSHCAIAVTSDYAQIENNRVIDKATRGIYSSLLPFLNSKLKLNADGSLSEATTAALTSQAGVNLDQMVRDQDLSAYAVVINPAQNVLTTSKIVIAVTLVINGVARQISIPIGFKPKIS